MTLVLQASISDIKIRMSCGLEFICLVLSDFTQWSCAHPFSCCQIRLGIVQHLVFDNWYDPQYFFTLRSTLFVLKVSCSLLFTAQVGDTNCTLLNKSKLKKIGGTQVPVFNVSNLSIWRTVLYKQIFFVVMVKYVLI